MDIQYDLDLRIPSGNSKLGLESQSNPDSCSDVADPPLSDQTCSTGTTSVAFHGIQQDCTHLIDCTVEDAHDCIHLAWSLMAKCKSELPAMRLDIAIYVFRHVLNRCPRTYPLHLDAQKRLALALCLRFTHSRRAEDLSESLSLSLTTPEVGSNDIKDASAAGVAPEGQDYGEMECLMNMGRGIMTNLSTSASLTTINTIVFLLRTSLVVIPTGHPNRIRALVDLAAAQHSRFCHSSDPFDLEISISCLRDALECCTEKNFTRFFIVLQLCAMLIIRSSHGGSVHHLREATELFRAEHDAAIGHPLALAHEKALLEAVQSCVDNPAPDITIALLREIIANRLDSAEHYDEVLHHLGEELLTRYQRNCQQYDLEEAVLLLRRTLELRPLPHAFRSDALDSLAHALANRFDQSAHSSDLDELVSLHREALQLRHATHPNRPISLHNLAVTLTKRSKKNGPQSDLAEAVVLAREALALLPTPGPRHGRSVVLSTLANALHSQFTQGGMPIDLEEAILLYKEALTLAESDSTRLEHLNNLATALLTRFRQNGQGCDVDEAILLHRETLDMCPVFHPKRSDSLSNLASALRLRFGHSRHSGDLDEAISIARMALQLRPIGHPDRPESLSNLASALSSRFDSGAQRNDLNEAIMVLKEAFQIWPSSSPGRYACVGDLATILRIRFEHGGLLDDLNEAILFYREVINHQNGLHPDRSVALGNLANALETRFEQCGLRSDLDDAISLNRQAFELDPPQRISRPRTIHNLAVKLYTRFQQAKDWKDNNEVISLERQALNELPNSHSLLPDILNVLANALGNRYEQNNQGDDLDESIALHREALGYPDSANAYPMNLATALLRRFRVAGHEGDLDEAICLLRKTVELRPSPHADRPISLINLASALGTRFGRAHQSRLGDLNEAILLHKQAIESLPTVHGYRHTAIFNLAVTFLQAHLITLDSKHLDDAMSSFSEALCCPSQSSSDRFRTAVIWARHANQTQHASTFEAYDAAMQGLSEIAALSLDIQSRQDVLRADSDGLARSAAKYAIEYSHVGKAIEYLELGRAVFWSQVLHLRSPFDELNAFAPMLADRLRYIAAELERGSHRKNDLKSFDNVSKMSEEAESTRLRRLDEEWVKGLAEARKLGGFEDFLQPPRLEKLQSYADELPVAYLVPHDAASDCLILTKGKIHHIPLSNMPMGRLRALVHMIKVATSQTPLLRSSLETDDLSSGITEKFRSLFLSEGNPERASKRAGHFELPSDSIFHYVLHILWEEVVKPVIGVLCLRKSKNPSTIRWCLTGLFTFLPIHAAGCYHPSLGTLENTSEYLISTYIPTLGVMLPTRNDVHKNTLFQMMAVIDTSLPFANIELKKIKQRVPNDCLIQLGIPGSPTHADTVYNSLPSASIVHFACHGTQDRLNPLNSGLHVHSGTLTISKILQQPLTKGSLAFLCACQTAMGDESVPDEAMSIGASLLFAGYGSVIATMWNIADADGPTVADVFYEELFRDPSGIPAPRPEFSRSALALHIAVQNLRSTGVEFRRWVPFIHLGK